MLQIRREKCVAMADRMLQDAGGPTQEVLQWQRSCCNGRGPIAMVEGLLQWQTDVLQWWTECCKMQVHIGLQHWPVNGLPWTAQHLNMVGTVCVATNLQKLVGMAHGMEDKTSTKVRKSDTILQLHFSTNEGHCPRAANSWISYDEGSNLSKGFCSYTC